MAPVEKPGRAPSLGNGGSYQQMAEPHAGWAVEFVLAKAEPPERLPMTMPAAMVARAIFRTMRMTPTSARGTTASVRPVVVRG